MKAGIAGGVIKGLGEAIIAHYEKLERQEVPSDLQGSVVEEPPTPGIVTPTAPVVDVIAPSPPPVPDQPVALVASVEERLRKLADLLSQNLISQAQYDTKRQQLLDEL